ncbi:MAG: TetR/AcrR family transcriptional regulator [Anaerolineae bacterium]|nr:TetR/AcrR family transcriptional regulator [Anaerolineae bacterium]
MPRPRFNKLPEEKRALMMRSAAKEFGTHGYENASLNRILETAEVSKGAAYYYFDDKADLFSTVVDYFMDLILGETDWREIELTAETFWPAITTMYSRQYAKVEEDRWMLSLMKAGQRLTAEARTNPLLATAFDRAWQWLKELFGRGQALGVVRTDLPDELLFSLIMHIDEAFDNWFVAHWDETTPEERQKLLMRLIESLQHFLAPV